MSIPAGKVCSYSAAGNGFSMGEFGTLGQIIVPNRVFPPGWRPRTSVDSCMVTIPTSVADGSFPNYEWLTPATTTDQSLPGILNILCYALVKESAISSGGAGFQELLPECSAGSSSLSVAIRGVPFIDKCFLGVRRAASASGFLGAGRTSVYLLLCATAFSSIFPYSVVEFAYLGFSTGGGGGSRVASVSGTRDVGGEGKVASSPIPSRGVGFGWSTEVAGSTPSTGSYPHYSLGTMGQV